MPTLITIRELARQLKAEDPLTAITYKTLGRFCSEGMRYYPDSNRRLTTREWYEEFVIARSKGQGQAVEEAAGDGEATQG